MVPWAKASGQHAGNRRGRGGRRWNAPLRAFYQQLRARGKEAKVDLVAVTRKLVVLANALLQANRLWQDAPPPRPSLN